MIYQQLKRLLLSQTSKDTAITLTGTAISTFIGVLFTIIVARLLGVVGFGLLSLVLTLTVVCTDIFDVALNTSMVRFVSADLARQKISRANRYLKLTFIIKLSLASIILLITLIFSRPLAQLIFNQNRPELVILIGLSVLGVVIYSFTIYHFYARKRFFTAAAAMVISMIFKLVLLFFLGLINAVSIVSIVLLYIVVGIVVAFLNQLSLPYDFLKSKGSLKLIKSFLRFNLPTTIGFIFVSVSTRLEDVLLIRLAGAEALGFYAAAIKMFLPAQFVAGSLSTVFAPRFASFPNLTEAKRYFFKALLASILIGSGFLLLIPISKPIIALIYGAQFMPASNALRLLVPAFTLFIIQAPFTSIILNYFGKARAFTLLSFFQLIITVIFSFTLIPRFHQNGAALAFTLAIAAYLMGSFVYTLKKFFYEPNR